MRSWVGATGIHVISSLVTYPSFWTRSEQLTTLGLYGWHNLTQASALLKLLQNRNYSTSVLHCYLVSCTLLYVPTPWLTPKKIMRGRRILACLASTGHRKMNCPTSLYAKNGNLYFAELRNAKNTLRNDHAERTWLAVGENHVTADFPQSNTLLQRQTP